MHVGDIVAAPLPVNGSWYRARVLGTLENGNLDLYFVDFGDNGDCPLRDLRALRSVWRPRWHQAGVTPVTSALAIGGQAVGTPCGGGSLEENMFPQKQGTEAGPPGTGI